MQDVFTDSPLNAGLYFVNHGKGGSIWTVPGGNPSGTHRNAPTAYGANLVFFDGHARWYDKKQLVPVGKRNGVGAQMLYSVMP